MKLRNLLTMGIVALFATTMSAQVVVNQMPLGSAQEDYFKAYDNVVVGLTGNWKKNGDYQYAEINGTGSTYVSVVATKKIKAIRFLATGNGQNSKFNPALIGFKEAPEAVITNGAIQVVDYAVAPEAAAINDGKPAYENAVWVTIDLDTVDLKAVYISRQWKKITTDPEDTKGANVGANSQTIRLFGFHVVLDGQEMPAIPEGPVVVEDPAITKFTIAGVDAKIDNAKKTITAVLPIGTDIAAALDAAVVEDNQDTLEVVIDAEAMTATLGELVYTLNLSVAEPSTNVVLIEANFSNGAKAFIKQDPATAEVPYWGEKPSFINGYNEDSVAIVSAEADKIIVTNGEAKAEYALSFKEYSAAPLEVSAAPYTFTGEEIGTWIASVYGWDEAKGIKFSKDVEEETNRRESEGKDRVYFFLPAADSVKLVSGSGNNRPVKISVNGVAYTAVSRTAKQGEAITIALGNVPAMVAIESDGNNGDAGFTSIQLVKAGEVPPVAPAITSFTIAGVKATIDNAKKTITAELPYGTDVAAALAAAVVEDNQDTLDVKIDPEAMTATLGELVYTLVITVADKPDDPQPSGNAVFYWQATDEAPANGAVVAAQGGTLTVASSDDAKTVSTESVAYAEGVADDMKATGSKAWKMGGNALSLELRLTEGTFKAGDILYISGYKSWKVSSTAEHSGDIATIETGTSKTDYQVGSATLAADAEVIYLMRAEGTGTGVAAIKVVRAGGTDAIETNELSSLVYADGVIFNPEHVALTVYSVSGSIIATSNTNINLNLVPAGLYIVSDGKNVMKVIR